ncbi:hypothetical protein TVAG_096390 [Trichomonas vaginalis G3]|uniref:Uncharacterized protein n=1 Tax=Trichomonas vaginalis (strain ATCC PRA-98 / G3) TaxID=412133 RepID=A2FT33_TRIV3|nr:nucleotide-diphospho-sugar transferases family [Trichomonas vaginalis G3]EAX91942.1 hypothetical protein TVAG_096390 [Trichomonas vaginalis G3]KAI5497539.1 nucleotide-diphospho-sugar transferases family [Trichomonas vaginalis G3]|eukprot:XP_001304872.1 hypothetical protein [Trichomonas vaginalis G3]
MGWFLFYLSFSSAHENITSFELIKNTSKYAYVTSINSLSYKDINIIQALTLGFTLKKYSPDIDRVLLIPYKMKLRKNDKDSLLKVYTYILRMPFITPHCQKGGQYLYEGKNFFFLNAWTLTHYHKILLVPLYSFYRKDPSSFFKNRVPAAPPHYKLWSMSHMGPFPNIENLMFKPSTGDLEKIEETYCQLYTDNFLRYQKRPLTDLILTTIITFYNSSIISVPFWYQFIYPGTRIDEKTKFMNVNDPRIISVKYEEPNTPWSNPFSLIREEWYKLVNEMYNELNNENFVPIVLTEIQDTYRHDDHPAILDTNDLVLTSYIEFYSRPKFQIFIQCILIFLISVFCVYFSLCFLEIDMYAPIIIIDNVNYDTNIKKQD